MRGSELFSVGNNSPTIGEDKTRDVTVASGSGATVRFWIEPTAVGSIPIEVQARSNGAGDALRRQIVVKVTIFYQFILSSCVKYYTYMQVFVTSQPEGVEKTYVRSYLVDLTDSSSATTTFPIAFPNATSLVPDSSRIRVTAMGKTSHLLVLHASFIVIFHLC